MLSSLHTLREIEILELVSQLSSIWRCFRTHIYIVNWVPEWSIIMKQHYPFAAMPQLECGNGNRSDFINKLKEFNSSTNTKPLIV